MTKKLNVKKLIIFLIILILFLSALLLGVFFFLSSAVGTSDEKIQFTVEDGSTYYSLISELKNQDLIKSEMIFKIYLKIKKPVNLDAGVFELNKGMSNSEIINALSKRNTTNPNAVTVTIPEGKHITDIAQIVSEKTINTKEQYLNVWSSEEFIDKLINKYWFIDEIIKDSKIRYPLEGYFFASTYELQNKEVTPEEVAYTLLNQMETVLNNYKKQIEESTYSVHQILTMASIIEYEAILDEDRALIAGVFYNRLNDGMKLQSCATVGYAIDEWKLSYTNSDLDVDSPYNTYYYSGLPIGPANAPSEKSIKAAIYPEQSDYYYFLADVCSENPKTYFSKTLNEHNSKAKLYLNCL